MKIKYLEKARDLNAGLQRVRASYQNNFKDKRNKLRVTISLNNGHNSDLVPVDVLNLDLGLDGPIAALVDQAYRRKIAELEKELQLLGVDLEDE